MKTIIFVHPHFTITGGAGNFILEIGKRLAKTNKIIVISQQVNQNTVKNYPELLFKSINGPTTDSFLFWLLFPYWQFKTYLLIKKHVSTNTSIFVSVFPSNWIVFPLRLFIKNKIYWFCQEPSAFIQDQKWINAINNSIKRTIAKILNPIFKTFDYQLSQIPNIIFSNSRYSQKNILNTYSRDSNVVYPGIDTKKLIPIDFKEKENYILTVSRLSKFKNIDILINSLSKIKDKNIKLKIVGNGDELKNLIIQSEKLNIKNRIDFLTNIDNQKLISIYQKAKIFVLCSKNEPFGIVPIEAMACGTPVICDNSGGPTETVINNQTGYTIKLDTASLTNSINKLLSDKKSLQLFSNNSVIQSKKFDWNNSVKELNKFI